MCLLNSAGHLWDFFLFVLPLHPTSKIKVPENTKPFTFSYTVNVFNSVTMSRFNVEGNGNIDFTTEEK